MNLLDQHRGYRLRLTARNEGKLKFHDSCYDLRAWSHDMRQRDRYLKEWIKRDMPLCILPVGALLGFFRAMTCQSKGRVTPRCHPDCKSKAILDNITIVCESIRKCLKADPGLDKYFCEEEFETSHWPCEKCLEALKNIKLFWKIILEKVFSVNLTKEDCPNQRSCEQCGTVRAIAKAWEEDMVHQANFIKNLTSTLLCEMKQTCLKKSSSCRSDISRKCNKVTIHDQRPFRLCSSKGDAGGNSSVCVNATRKDSRHACKRPLTGYQCKSVSACAKTNEASCNTCALDLFSEYCDFRETKAKYECLQREYECQKCEIEKLKQENNSLKCQLQSTCVEYPPWKSQILCGTALFPAQDMHASFPEPFEASMDDGLSMKKPLKPAESELIITMKNGKEESYRHVSLLQVLHKTNDPFISDIYEGPYNKNAEDPIQLLTKVQQKLGAMVKREMYLARNNCDGDSEIKASFHRISL